ncbi:RxLR effector protein [Phytophthora megakarya]|uniref:RxLR effector protein n=1 Tax=Phytophthora megakarya TaxID=4795 RepID=A0A225WGK4_9STRA|nr:RxLR effector protein [Phytophthora megakarya]
MRFLHAIVVTAVTTLSVTSSATTIPGRSAQVSTMNSLDFTDMDQRISGEKRSLRYHAKNYHPNDVDLEGLDDDDDEERFSSQKLKDLLAGKTKTLFAKWRRKGYDPIYIRSKMDKHITSGYVVKFTQKDVNDVVRRYSDVWKPRP